MYRGPMKLVNRFQRLAIPPSVVKSDDSGAAFGANACGRLDTSFHTKQEDIHREHPHSLPPPVHPTARIRRIPQLEHVDDVYVAL